jgi:hypothetical protein
VRRSALPARQSGATSQPGAASPRPKPPRRQPNGLSRPATPPAPRALRRAVRVAEVRPAQQPGPGRAYNILKEVLDAARRLSDAAKKRNCTWSGCLALGSAPRIDPQTEHKASSLAVRSACRASKSLSYASKRASSSSRFDARSLVGARVLVAIVRYPSGVAPTYRGRRLKSKDGGTAAAADTPMIRPPLRRASDLQRPQARFQAAVRLPGARRPPMLRQYSWSTRQRRRPSAKRMGKAASCPPSSSCTRASQISPTMRTPGFACGRSRVGSHHRPRHPGSPGQVEPGPDHRHAMRASSMAFASARRSLTSLPSPFAPSAAPRCRPRG